MSETANQTPKVNTPNIGGYLSCASSIMIAGSMFFCGWTVHSTYLHNTNKELPTAEEIRKIEFDHIINKIDTTAKYSSDSFVTVSYTLNDEDIAKFTNKGYKVTKKDNQYTISWGR